MVGRRESAGSHPRGQGEEGAVAETARRLIQVVCRRCSASKTWPGGGEDVVAVEGQAGDIPRAVLRPASRAGLPTTLALDLGEGASDVGGDGFRLFHRRPSWSNGWWHRRTGASPNSSFADHRVEGGGSILWEEEGMVGKDRSPGWSGWVIPGDRHAGSCSAEVTTARSRIRFLPMTSCVPRAGVIVGHGGGHAHLRLRHRAEIEEPQGI